MDEYTNGFFRFHNNTSKLVATDVMDFLRFGKYRFHENGTFQKNKIISNNRGILFISKMRSYCSDNFIDRSI